jgi:Protein of unknown function (DUF3306)
MSGRDAAPDDPAGPERFSLRRWSRRKHAAARAPGAASTVPQPDPASVPSDPAKDVRSEADDTTHVAVDALAPDTQTCADAAAPAEPVASDAQGTASLVRARVEPGAIADRPPADTAPLPPIESLTAESNFAAFMRPDVDEAVKRSALRKLFGDPRFNVMDGLDIYVDDYTRSDPVEPSLARELLFRVPFDGRPQPSAAPDAVAARDVVALPVGDASPEASSVDEEPAAPQAPTGDASDAPQSTPAPR